MATIECENLVKLFGRTRPVRALDGLTLAVEEGEVFGLLGPNGSGKTTFVKCCLNIIFPTSGRLRILSRRPGHPRTARETGYLPETPNFYDHLTGREFLHYHAELARLPLGDRVRRINEMLALVHLDRSAVNRRLRTYSRGMLQRIGLAQALLGRPKLVFLDEPQSGLDPIGRRQVKDIMREAAQDGATVLFSSHVLADVEDVADRVAIIDRGRVRRIAPLEDLTLHTNRVSVRLRSRGKESDESASGSLPEKLLGEINELGAGGIQYSDGVLTCALREEQDIPRLVHVLTSAECEIFEVSQERMSLEETFLQEFGELPTTPAEPAAPS